MIASKTEIKALLEMMTTTNDDLINRLIPIIEDDIRQYCNNAFLNSNVYMQSGDIVFTHNSTSADTIAFDGSGDGFVDSQFKAGETIQVLGSYNNDNFFEIESLTSVLMTLYSTSSRPHFDELITEDESVLIRLSQIKYPKALKSIVAQMVNYKLTTYDYSVSGETVSRYSVTYNNNDIKNGYPSALMVGLNRWKSPVFL